MIEQVEKVVRIDGNLIPLKEVLSITQINPWGRPWRFELLLTNNCKITIERWFSWDQALHEPMAVKVKTELKKGEPYWEYVPHSEENKKWAANQLRNKWLAKGELDQIHKELVALWKPGA